MSARAGSDSVRTGLLWISPWLAGFLLFLAAPLAMSLYYSFTDYPVLEKPVWIGLDNYNRLLRDPTFWTVLRNTLVFVSVVVPASTVLALLLAVLLNREPLGWRTARAVILLPTMVPAAAAAMAWLFVFNSDVGVLNLLLRPVLGVVGVSPPAWLQTMPWAFVAMVIVALWQVGQSVLIYQAALREVPRSLLEAASIDGAGSVRRFFLVTLPMIGHVVLFNVIVGMIGATQVFVFPFIMTAGGPGTGTYFLTHALYDNAFLFGPKMGYASALAWVQMALVGLLTYALFRASRGRGVTRA